MVHGNAKNGLGTSFPGQINFGSLSVFFSTGFISFISGLTYFKLGIGVVFSEVLIAF